MANRSASTWDGREVYSVLRRRGSTLRLQNFGACQPGENPLSKKLPTLPTPLAVSQPPKELTAKPQASRKPGRKATANRFAVLNEFVDCSLAGLSKTELVVWFTLYRDTRNGTARTSQADIARRGGVSKRAVQYATRRLERRGLLRCVFRGGINQGPSRWRVLSAAKKPSDPL
ncbi:MAG: MarR family transcriptional regulator [Planctomycetes bacterium]|nr:MarR family transcriptional regulator [Planctomycetota bacterium]